MSTTVKVHDDAWKVLGVERLVHKCITSICIGNDDGFRVIISVTDEALERGKTTYVGSDTQAKESPQTDVESVVGAGTDFLMKVTEEAVISGMILVGGSSSGIRDPNIRKHYRDAAEDITLEEVKRFVNDPHREGDPDEYARVPVPIPDPDWISKQKILSVDRYDPKKAGYEEYLDATQGK